MIQKEAISSPNVVIWTQTNPSEASYMEFVGKGVVGYTTNVQLLEALSEG